MAILARTLARAQPIVRLQVGTMPVVVVAIGAVVLISMVRVVLVSGLTTTNFDIQTLEQERLERQARVRELEREVGSLQSLERIEREAKDRLGLVPPVARESVEVNVPPPVESQLSTRHPANEEPEAGEQGSSWWRDLLKLLPFY